MADNHSAGSAATLDECVVPSQRLGVGVFVADRQKHFAVVEIHHLCLSSGEPAEAEQIPEKLNNGYSTTL